MSGDLGMENSLRGAPARSQFYRSGSPCPPHRSGGHLVYQPSWGLKAPSLGLWGLNSIRVAFSG